MSMRLHKWVFGGILLASMSALAIDQWVPHHVKDEFDINSDEQVDHHPSRFVPVEPSAVSQPIQAPEPFKKTESKPEPKVIVKTYKNLKSTPVHLQDGSSVKFNKVVIFSCDNIPKKRFLFNKKQNDHCWIKNVKDAAQIAEKIGIDQFKSKSAVFEICPDSMAEEKTCSPKKIRNF